ncbi:Dipeptidase [Gryllus bimaculatus]|nr:Dipeptidase [Gryllus bimaculatus]
MSAYRCFHFARPGQNVSARVVPVRLRDRLGSARSPVRFPAGTLDTLHNDLPWNIRKFVHNQLREFNFAADLRAVVPWSKSPWSHTDLQRMRRGMVGGQHATPSAQSLAPAPPTNGSASPLLQFWAAYVPCESQHLNAVQLTLEQIDLIKRLIDKYQDELQFATSAAEMEVENMGWTCLIPTDAPSASRDISTPASHLIRKSLAKVVADAEFDKCN